MFIEIQDNQPNSMSVRVRLGTISREDLHTVPVRGVANRIVQVFDHLFPRRHIATRVHRGDVAAFRVVVGELWQCAPLQIAEDLVCVDKIFHGIVLNPLGLITRFGQDQLSLHNSTKMALPHT
jgi:hypothetical protein